MAEIDTNPMLPIWHKRPTRKVDPDEQALADRERQQREQNKEQQSSSDSDEEGSSGSSLHIDEYA